MSSTPASPFRPPFPATTTPSPDGADEAPVVPLSLFGFECSLDTVPLDTLESVTRAVSREAVERWFDRFPTVQEVALLSTCHRVEIYVLARNPEDRERWREVLPEARGAWRARDGWEAVHHLFRVAAGRESSAMGEAEVRLQVQAASRTVVSRHPRPVLREVFLEAASAAREVSDPEAAPVSIASLAVERLRELVDRPNPRVLVVGSGTVGRQVACDLAPFARVTLVFHARPPDPPFLRAAGVDAVRLDRLPMELRTADAVVTAAKFGDRGLRADELPRDRPIVLVDLGMPRNIDPAARELPNVRLVDLQELYGISRASSAPDLFDGRVEELATRFYDHLAQGLSGPWVDALLRAAEATRRSELKTARPFLGPLDPDQEAAIERLTRRLVARLVIPPVERVRTLPAGPEGDLQLRIALELLRPTDPDP